MVAASEAAAARAVVVALDRLAALPAGAEDRTARTRLAWDVDRLVAQDARRLALTPGLDGARRGRSRPPPPPRGAPRTPRRRPTRSPRLQAEFEGQLLPQLDLIAARSRDRRRRATARAAAGLLAASLARPARRPASALFGGRRAPARRRIGAWVARATDEATARTASACCTTR